MRSFLFDVNAPGQAAGFSESGNRGHGDGVSRAAVWSPEPDDTMASVEALPPLAESRRALPP